MPKIFNVYGEDWERCEDRPGWRSRESWVGARIGAELIGGSLYELQPGSRLWPYHTHYANEEWLLVVRGRPTLRAPDGEHDLREGDVVAFARGDDGLHQVSNRTDAPVRVLMLSTLIAPDLVHYRDSGKFGARDAKGKRVLLSRPGPLLDYWDGED
ncbi:MAG TPA: cupin domain-containing protein [Solirubrobacteraceae bacterium]|nr:cupin domain-containing protein [Solirubrobacteraceae bacterium]